MSGAISSERPSGVKLSDLLTGQRAWLVETHILDRQDMRSRIWGKGKVKRMRYFFAVLSPVRRRRAREKTEGYQWCTDSSFTGEIACRRVTLWWKRVDL